MKKTVIIELVLFLILMTILTMVGVKIFKRTFDIGTTYHLVFHDIDSVQKGSPVKMLGVDVGYVTKIKWVDDEIHVDILVHNENIELPPGTRATIEFFGIAGSRSIELKPPLEKNNYPEGTIISDDPIRIGDALGIMGSFLRAMMVSIGGLYEYAKNKSQDRVQNDTQRFLSGTNAASNSLTSLTNTMENTQHSLHKSMTGTHAGMERVYKDSQLIDNSINVNRTIYSSKLVKLHLIRFRRGIESFTKNANSYSATANYYCDKGQACLKYWAMYDEFDKAVAQFENALDAVQASVTPERIDKITDTMTNVKNISEKMNKSIK